MFTINKMIKKNKNSFSFKIFNRFRHQGFICTSLQNLLHPYLSSSAGHKGCWGCSRCPGTSRWSVRPAVHSFPCVTPLSGPEASRFLPPLFPSRSGAGYTSSPPKVNKFSIIHGSKCIVHFAFTFSLSTCIQHLNQTWLKIKCLFWL